MPRCGSQITICDLPVRFDNYKGCTHACEYCFVKAKYDITNIEKDEGIQSLVNFIEGNRNHETRWCDWDIPIHWGGVSDPLQPAEKIHGTTLKALEVFARTGYPFVISTKGALLGESEYIDLLARCNCVVQVSLVSPKYNTLEAGAPSFAQRMEIIEKITPQVKRVIIRAQPYSLEVLKDILAQIPEYSRIGVYGLTIEGMKYKRMRPGLQKVGGDYCYPAKVLKQHFEMIKDACHTHGLKFYCAENRLRKMGDSLCCCGIDGLDGFQPNTFNLNHYLYDRDNYVPTAKMQETGTADSFKATCQNTYSTSAFAKMSLEEIMNISAKDKAVISQLVYVPK